MTFRDGLDRLAGKPRHPASGCPRSQLKRSFRTNQFASVAGVFERQQVVDRDLGKVRIRVPGFAVRERELRALGDDVDVVSRENTQLIEPETLQKAQLL